MPRGMGDTFHRLLWITLVAVAFTFTLILTSVFVDIDDLLAKRSSPVLKQEFVTETVNTELPVAFIEDLQEFPSSEEDTEENESTFRTKRSLESNNHHFQVKNPKLKKILTSRLAALLEELDEDESSKAINSAGLVAHNENPKYVSTEQIEQFTDNVVNVKGTNNNKDRQDILHLAMHNILLQGIIEHMDLNEVYKKVHMLIKSFELNTDRDIEELNESKLNRSKPVELMKIVSHDSYAEEDQFINELIKCNKLQKQIFQNQIAEKKESPKDSHMVIKTTIEIINNDKETENYKNSTENTTGSIKLVYNGKEIKAANIDDKGIQHEAMQDTHNDKNQQKKLLKDNKQYTEGQNKTTMAQAIANYLKTHSIKFHNKYDVLTKGSFVTKRLKRQIKIRYLDDEVTTEKSKSLKQKPKQHDDELYVEIETHFDGKGTKGEKKKKLVRTLIDKIQKAINSNAEVFDQEQNVQQKHLQVKKRLQNPIDQNELTVNTKSPIDVIEHRQLNPISKSSSVIQPLTSVLDKSGETWKKMYNGPGFLTASKSVNSAEMRELDIDYNSVMENGIPKRLQKPINTENDDSLKPSEYTKMGNVTLLLKDINSSGFSIGINQYTDEPPDKETLKMYTGLENLIQAYHQHFDQAESLVSNESEEHLLQNTNHEIKRRDVNMQKIINNHFTQVNPYKRRAMNIKLISNVKSKSKFNKFINTNAMARKKLFHKNQRQKRQLNKIRIIASDRYPSASREDVFLVSRENIFANRAIVKDEEIPEVEIGNEKHYDIIAPYSSDMDIRNLHRPYLSSLYDTKSMHTELMAKYPHMFLEKISRSTDFGNAAPSDTIEEKQYQNFNTKSTVNVVNDSESNEKNVSTTNVNEIVNAILPRNNYKVVVKVLPKNNTNVGPGYKEIHTLINKSYDKNGVRYVSSLNVSELSKFESLNKIKEENKVIVNKSNVEYQPSQINLLLELHKEKIDQQLEHLKMESQKLRQMIGHEYPKRNISHLTDIFKQLGLKSSNGRNDLSFHDNDTDKHVKTISNTLLVKYETTTKSLYTTVSSQEDTKQQKIINSIKESENITRKILQKLDENTNILQLFLQNLMDQKNQKVEEITPAFVNSKNVTNDTPKNLVTEQVVQPFIEQLHTNYTNAIPFIYAFQHPLSEHQNKPSMAVANVVYHGHIHTNKLSNQGKGNNFVKSVTNHLKTESETLNNHRGNNGNVTRFFIDDLENDFKLVSNVNDHIAVKKNTTKV